MRKIDFFSSGLIISLFLFGCSPSNKVKEYMLNDYQFSAAKDNANDIIRLTMNKDNTYEFCYKNLKSSITRIIIYIEIQIDFVWAQHFFDNVLRHFKRNFVFIER